MNEMTQVTGAFKSPFRTRYDNFIGGTFVPPVKGQYFDNITPITGAKVCEVAHSTAEDVELALNAAHAAKEGWGKTSAAERSNVLLKIADRIEDNLDLIAAAETWDNGKPIRETTAADIPLSVDHFRYFAGVLRSQEGTMSEIDHDTVAYHFHEPLGVVGQIIPWNFSILMAAWKLAPALAAGNCIVMKPAEQTPAAIMVLVEIIADLLPAGVLNIVNGMGPEVGGPLAESPRIAKIAFTGSTETGRIIMKAATRNLIPVTLELGGKSPQLVFDDADLDAALPFLVNAGVQNAGQTCSASSRILVQRGVYDEVVKRMAEAYSKLTVGPAAEDLRLGPLISARQKELVSGFIEKGSDLTLAAEGVIVDGTPTTGAYVKPTLFADVPADHELAQKEIFGPVQVIIPFDTEAEALAIANGTEFGLVASVWSRDGARQMRLAKKLHAGQVFLNNYGAAGGAELPFGGVGKSGHGREKGFEALYGFSQLKTVAAFHG